ncbi:hypothetical protein MRX96_049771, partial [Rhipicephalus microplus]
HALTRCNVYEGLGLEAYVLSVCEVGVVYPSCSIAGSLPNASPCPSAIAFSRARRVHHSRLEFHLTRQTREARTYDDVEVLRFQKSLHFLSDNDGLPDISYKSERELDIVAMTTSRGDKERDASTGTKDTASAACGAKPKKGADFAKPREVADSAKPEEVNDSSKSKELNDSTKPREVADSGKPKEVVESGKSNQVADSAKPPSEEEHIYEDIDECRANQQGSAGLASETILSRTCFGYAHGPQKAYLTITKKKCRLLMHFLSSGLHDILGGRECHLLLRA